MTRLPLIRHVRYLWLRWHFRRWWFSLGRYYWLTPHPKDAQYLAQVWKGEA